MRYKKTALHVHENAFRTPTPEEIWNVFQKHFEFEEPASKWSRLRKALKKQVHKGSYASQDSASRSLSEQGTLFADVFGTYNMDTSADTFLNDSIRNFDKACCLTNTMLFFEDLKRFSRLAFDMWWNDDSLSKLPQPAREEELPASVLAGGRELSFSERRWLDYGMSAAPAWDILTVRNQLWKSDARAKLVDSFITAIGTDEVFGRVKEESFQSAQRLWQELVRDNRADLPGDFLPSTIVLVEGQTETILLPAFARMLGADLNKMAVLLQPCGGAQQVVRHYLNLKELTVLPVICVLDSDVQESAEMISDSLREGDRLHTLSVGEIEDTFSRQAFIRLLNVYMKKNGIAPFSFEELTGAKSRVETLDRHFKSNGLGSFDKIGFAKVVAEHLHVDDVPADGKRIIDTLKEIENAGIKFRF